MSYDYTGYQIQLGTLMALTSANPALPPTDPYFLQMLPFFIDQAEQRIYRDLDIQSTRTQGTISVTQGTPTVALPSSPTVYVVESISIQANATGAPPIGTPLLLTPVDANFLLSTYPPAYWSTAQGPPQYYYVQDQGTAVIGPSPDQSYTLFTIYTFRPPPLSAANTTTILTETWPDLFMAASMVAASAYQKNFGAQSDDPKMASSWEAQYQLLLAGSKAEEAAKKGMGVPKGTPMRPGPFSAPPAAH
jgi:hypothetical protein